MAQPEAPTRRLHRAKEIYLLVAGFRLCRSGENVNDQLRPLDHRVDAMSV